MNNKVQTRYNNGGMIRTYVFRVVVEPDEDRWFACCPVLESKGGATWGYTKEEAYKNIQEVVQMVVEGLIEDGEPIPVNPEKGAHVFSELHAMVTI